jgi:hypothetical protein
MCPPVRVSSWTVSIRSLAIVVREHHGACAAHEKRGDGIFHAIRTDGDDRRGRLTVHEARKEGKVLEGTVPQGLEGLAVSLL